MGKWVHRLLYIDKEKRIGVCSLCGQVKLKKKGRDKYGCYVAYTTYKKSHGKSPYLIKTLEEKYAAYGVVKEDGCVCEICGSKDKICLDHSHENKKFRGWLCRNCNLMLGFAKDNADTLKMAIIYLDKNSGV